MNGSLRGSAFWWPVFVRFWTSYVVSWHHVGGTMCSPKWNPAPPELLYSVLLSVKKAKEERLSLWLRWENKDIERSNKIKTTTSSCLRMAANQFNFISALNVCLGGISLSCNCWITSLKMWGSASKLVLFLLQSYWILWKTSGASDFCWLVSWTQVCT